MHRLFLLLMVFILVQEVNSQTTLSQYLRSVFLNAPLEKGIFKWSDYYKHDTLLTYKQIDNKWEGGNSEGNLFRTHTDGFLFTSHPELSFPFEKGEIDIIVTSKDSVRDISSAVLILNFIDTASAALAYRNISLTIKSFTADWQFLYDEDTKITSLFCTFLAVQTKYVAYLFLGKYANGHVETPLYVRLMITELPPD